MQYLSGLNLYERYLMWVTVGCCLITYSQFEYILQSVLDGYNGTIMAYGQTGTGKTYTLGRLGEDDASERGIMVRALEDMIANTSAASDNLEISYLQV